MPSNFEVKTEEINTNGGGDLSDYQIPKLVGGDAGAIDPSTNASEMPAAESVVMDDIEQAQQIALAKLLKKNKFKELKRLQKVKKLEAGPKMAEYKAGSNPVQTMYEVFEAKCLEFKYELDPNNVSRMPSFICELVVKIKAPQTTEETNGAETPCEERKFVVTGSSKKEAKKKSLPQSSTSHILGDLSTAC